jgi:hypothetical protein
MLSKQITYYSTRPSFQLPSIDWKMLAFCTIAGAIMFFTLVFLLYVDDMRAVQLSFSVKQIYARYLVTIY